MEGFFLKAKKGVCMILSREIKKFSFKEWSQGILKFVFHEFVANGKLLGSLILLTVFSMFLQSLQNAFEKSTVSKVAYSIVYMVLDNYCT